jgi:hypothetical protein
MPKQIKLKLKLKQKQKQKNSRKKRGGNSDILRSLASIKSNTQMILADIDRIEDENDENDENCDLSEIKKNAIQDAVLIKNLIEDQQKVESQEKNPLDQVITTDGFNGTIGELLSKLREKVEKLSQYNNAGHDQTVAHLKNLLDSISSESANVNKMKEILKGGRLKFKNNKTKRRRNNKRRKIQTKRR